MKSAACYQRKPLPIDETKAIVNAGTGLKAFILSKFITVPNLCLAPTEFAKRYDLPNPIHSVRPRFTELCREGILAETNEIVKSVFGKSERRYKRAVNQPTQLTISF